MRHHGFASRIFAASSALALVAGGLGASGAAAQERPADLTVLPPVPTDYDPGKTAWGDPNISHSYQIEYLNNARVLFQRPAEYGMRFWQTDEEHARRVAAAERSDGNFTQANENGIGAGGTRGPRRLGQDLAVRHAHLDAGQPGRRPAAAVHRRGQAAARSRPLGLGAGHRIRLGQRFRFAGTAAFRAASRPRCTRSATTTASACSRARAMSAIHLEMLGNRVIPLVANAPRRRASLARPVEAWLGNSVGWWEGNTLVIETTNIKSGDSVTHDHYARNGSVLNLATQAVPPYNTIPTSTQAKTVERLTMTGPNSLMHELTYSDPEVFTAPWTTRVEWIRDDNYEFFEYACHEGNRMPRDYITASRAKRRDIAAGLVDPNAPDDRANWARIFDRDPAVAAAPPPQAHRPRPPRRPRPRRRGAAAAAG